MRTLLLSLAMLVMPTLAVSAGEAPKEESAVLETVLDATRDNDLAKFVSVGDDRVKAAMTADKLAQVSGQLAPLMKQGYGKEFMGVLDRRAFKTYYWKLDFDQEGAPDMLAELSISKGKVAGFFIR